MLGKIGFSLNIVMPAALGLEAKFYAKLRFRFQPSANHPQSSDGAAGGKACAEKPLAGASHRLPLRARKLI